MKDRNDDVESIRADFPPGCAFFPCGRSFLVIGPQDPTDSYARRIWLQPAPSIYGPTFAKSLTIGGSKNGLHFYEDGHMMMSVPEMLWRTKSSAEMERARFIGKHWITRTLYRPIGAVRWWWVMRRARKQYAKMTYCKEERPDTYGDPEG